LQELAALGKWVAEEGEIDGEHENAIACCLGMRA